MYVLVKGNIREGIGPKLEVNVGLSDMGFK